MNWIDIENQESGLSVRNKLNSAFKELAGRHNKTLALMGTVGSYANLPANASLGDTYYCASEGLFYFLDSDNVWRQLGGEKKLKITPTVAVGGIVKDREINKTPSEILRDMLCPYVAPKITLSATPNVLLYGKQYTVALKATLTKGSNALKTVTIDGTTTQVTTTTATKSVTLTPSDSSKTSLSYSASVADSEDNTANATASVTLTGGVFLFFSEDDTISKTLNLNFTTHNCQSERTKPDGTYSLSHTKLEYFYIVVPNTDAMKVNDVKSGGYVVPMQELWTSSTMKQNNVTVNMRVYRSIEKQRAGTFDCDINPK